jgi:hypothetical protein
MFKSPPLIANIIATSLNTGIKDVHTSKIDNSVKPIIPISAVALLKILPRSITTDINTPAISPRKKLMKVPGE